MDYFSFFQFSMGIKTNSASKMMETPGPGEYETDVVPLNQASAAHVIGTGTRSDLGVGKAYNFPGPG